MDELEQNFLEAIGIALSQPRAGKNKIHELKKIHWRLNRQNPMKAIGDILLQCIEESTDNTPPSYVLLVKRLTQVLGKCEEKNKALQIIRNSKESQYDSAIWKISEKAVAVILKMPAKHADPLANIRDQAQEVIRVTSKDPQDNSEIIQPFRGLEQGDPLEHMPIVTKPSGIPALDTGILDSGFVNGAGIVLSGQTNIGKSNLTNEFIRASGFIGGTPLQISIEDDKKLTELRWTAFLLGTSTKEVNKMTNEEKTLRLLKKYEKQPWAIAAIERMRLWAPKEPPTMEQILQKIDDYENATGKIMSLVALDYIQNINVDGGSDTRATKLGNAAKRYFAVGAQRGRTSIIVSQAKSEITAADEFLSIREAMAESFAISHNAHYVFSLKHPPEEVVRRMREKDDPRAQINLGLPKNKFGPVGGVYAIFDGKRSKWNFFNTANERKAFWNRTDPH